ncbi:MAG TPA: tyrosine--tRNA ligase [Thermoanaerobaculia bacterium]|jgi:tyrosyl-tRNA synthetase|nr:tyrosine--tRNA ligase [Thermoanaerobaculia bacterium]
MSELLRSFVEELQWRGLLSDVTPGVDVAMRSEPVVGYIGFDPSASSLHVGSLVPVMALARMQRCGHSPIAIAGGGTGLIGDPAGKKTERPLLTPEQVEINLLGIKRQLSRFLDFDRPGNAARIINNADWLTRTPLTDFLRDVGKHFRVNVMLSRESVRRRLESEEGISFTEFSYMLLQAYDFLVLYQKYRCTLQMGGSDQWGNIVAGVDLIGRVEGAKAHGIVFPLVTSASGEKFGKTEDGTIWLDPERTSPYHFYQFWLRTDDRDAIRYLKYFTWLEAEEIGELERQFQAAPEAREAQRRLAEEVTRMIHGDEALAHAQRTSQLFFSEDVAALSADEILQVVDEAPATDLPASKIAGAGIPLSDLLVHTGLAASKNEARRFIEAGSIYLSNRPLTDPRRAIGLADCIDGKILLLRRGKSNYHLVKIVP